MLYGKRSMPAIRLGIVGSGWGANHARVAAELAPALEVAALCSRRPERIAALAEELDLPRAALETDWQALVARDDVDLVVNTAPDYLHYPISMAAIRQRKHVFCEKPLAMNEGQAREMVEAAEAGGVRHFTGFTWRFAPPVATIRRLIDQGRLGDVRFVDGHFRIGPPLPGKEWQFDPELRAGGVLGNLGVHLIDVARHLAAETPQRLPEPDSEPWRVWAHAGLFGRAAEGTTWGAENDVMWLQIEMGGVPVRLQASQLGTYRAAEPVRIEVHGSVATAIGYANPLFPERMTVGVVPRISQAPEWVEPLDYPGGPPAPPTAALPSRGLLRPTIRHLYEGHIVPLITGQASVAPETPTFRDGWIAQRVMDAALRSAEGGGWEAV